MVMKIAIDHLMHYVRFTFHDAGDDGDAFCRADELCSERQSVDVRVGLIDLKCGLHEMAHGANADE